RVRAEHRLDIGQLDGRSHDRPASARTSKRTGRATSGSPRARTYPRYTPGTTSPRTTSTVADVLALGSIVSAAGWKRPTEAGTIRPSWEARAVRRGMAEGRRPGRVWLAPRPVSPGAAAPWSVKSPPSTEPNSTPRGRRIQFMRSA